MVNHHFLNGRQGNGHADLRDQAKDAANRFLANNVAPNLLPGIHPKRSVQELHSLLIS